MSGKLANPNVGHKELGLRIDTPDWLSTGRSEIGSNAATLTASLPPGTPLPDERADGPLFLSRQVPKNYASALDSRILAPLNGHCFVNGGRPRFLARPGRRQLKPNLAT